MSSTHKEHDRHEYIEHENEQREEEAKKKTKSINNLIYSMVLYEYILNVLLELKLFKFNAYTWSVLALI
jgi:hypothetical protein